MNSMKKVFLNILAVLVMIALTACSEGKSKEEYEMSKEAYENINTAYEITSDFGSDIYEAWRLGIYDDEEILDEGCAYLAKELHLSEAEVTEGAAYSLASIIGNEWEECTDEEKRTYREMVDSSFELMEDNLFTWCVHIVSNVYVTNGKVAEAQECLETAKGYMRDLSENYSDYEHYPALKGYYTTTSSFFEFCQNPTGSFEQLKTTIENYKTTARDYNADLDYIFED